MRHSWLWEQFEDRADYERRHMFGCQAVYLHGRMMFCVASKSEPWSGLLCVTAREHHSSLITEFPFLRPHPVLGKWLYLSDADDGFEHGAQSLMEQVGAGDARFGIVPGTRSRAKRRR